MHLHHIVLPYHQDLLHFLLIYSFSLHLILVSFLDDVVQQMVLLLVIHLFCTNSCSRILSTLNVLLHVLVLPYISQLASSVLVVLDLQFPYHYVDLYILGNTSLILLILAQCLFHVLPFGFQMQYLPNLLLFLMVKLLILMVCNLQVLEVLKVSLHLLEHEFYCLL